jgi:hypothetical protein
MIRINESVCLNLHSWFDEESLSVKLPQLIRWMHQLTLLLIKENQKLLTLNYAFGAKRSKPLATKCQTKGYLLFLVPNYRVS